MNRPQHSAIRERLLQATVHYVLRNGVGELSLRPLAKEIGTSARMLMHHFGSKETLVSLALQSIEQGFVERVAAATATGHGPGDMLRRLWRDTAAPAMEPALRAVFEVWGQALIHPEKYPSFLRWVTEAWIDLLRRRFEQSPRTADDAVTLATLAVGAFQGLHLVRLTGGDPARSERALGVLLGWLD